MHLICTGMDEGPSVSSQFDSLQPAEACALSVGRSFVQCGGDDGCPLFARVPGRRDKSPATAQQHRAERDCK